MSYSSADPLGKAKPLLTMTTETPSKKGTPPQIHYCVHLDLHQRSCCDNYHGEGGAGQFTIFWSSKLPVFQHLQELLIPTSQKEQKIPSKTPRCCLSSAYQRFLAYTLVTHSYTGVQTWQRICNLCSELVSKFWSSKRPQRRRQ